MVRYWQMMQCAWCGAVFDFDDAELHQYREDMNGEGAYQTFLVRCCPECGSEDIDKIYEEEEE